MVSSDSCLAYLRAKFRGSSYVNCADKILSGIVVVRISHISHILAGLNRRRENEKIRNKALLLLLHCSLVCPGRFKRHFDDLCPLEVLSTKIEVLVLVLLQLNFMRSNELS